MKIAKFLCLTVVLVACVMMTGCTRSTAIKTDEVTGTVLDVDGTPLVGGTINFSPITQGQGNAAYATIDEKGKYKLQTLLGDPDAGTTPGKYKVTIQKSEMVPTGKKTRKPEGGTEDEMTSKLLVPKAYASFSSTPLQAEVVAGKNNKFDFQLKKDGT